MSQNTSSRDDQSNGPWTSLHLDPIRIHGFRDLKGCRTSLQGEHIVAAGMLPCRQQDEWMRELHQELTRYMARAGLQSKTRPARPSLRSSHGYSTSQTQSPSAGPQGQSSAKWLREDTLAEWSRSKGISILGDEIGQGGTRAPPLNAQAGSSYFPLAPHNPILPMSCLATPWKISITIEILQI